VAPPRANAAATALPARKPGPLPETGSIEAVSPAQASQLALMADALDSQDYFQALQVPQTSNAGDIKRAFYRESRVYHPDRFYHLTDEAAKGDIGAIYRRITEAYYVLRDDAKRKKYLADLAGPDRASKLRFSEASEAEQKAEAKKAAEDEYGTNPKSRQFFKTALSDIASQNWGSAERNLKMGLTYEPGNAKFKERLAEVQRKLEDARKTTGDSFKIK
jgi:DnaJ-class molecular chaperone